MQIKFWRQTHQRILSFLYLYTEKHAYAITAAQSLGKLWHAKTKSLSSSGSGTAQTKEHQMGQRTEHSSSPGRAGKPFSFRIQKELQ